MYRVGILGAENSHASGFAQIFNGYRPEVADEFNDIRVIGVGGRYPEANRALLEKYGLELMVEKPEDLLGKVDAIMVPAREGRYHAEFARPFIEAGIPAFIDKPFTSNLEEAVELVRLAKAKNVPLVGGSSLKLCADTVKMADAFKECGDKIRSGDVTAPVSMVNEYGNFWFYAAHLTEICLRVFGSNPEWVWACEHKGGVCAVVHYPGFDITNHFTDQAYHYSVTLHTTDGIVHQPLAIDDFILLECRSFAKMLRHGTMDFTYEELVRPVSVLEAIVRSCRSGCKEAIAPVVL